MSTAKLYAMHVLCSSVSDFIHGQNDFIPHDLSPTESVDADISNTKTTSAAMLLHVVVVCVEVSDVVAVLDAVVDSGHSVTRGLLTIHSTNVGAAFASHASN